jgi:hypothetical protein
VANETERLIDLVRVALDEFESASLSASLRRVLRIAQLRGDSEVAWHCRQDLRPYGGSKELRRTELQAMWPDADITTLSHTDRRLLEEWISEREVDMKQAPLSMQGKDDGSGLMIAGSVSEVEAELALREGKWRDESDVEDLPYRAELDQRARLDRIVLERVRFRTYAYLSRCETELALGGIAANVFDRHRRRVDGTLAAVAPEILEQFNAAHRRAVDGDPESLAHALTSCRRILKAVADVVFPPQSEPIVGQDGKPHVVDDEHYKSRIMAFIQQAPHETAMSVLTASFNDLDNRVNALNTLDSKGVHADVQQSEVDLCVVQTYLLAGEILAIHAEQMAM